MSSPRPLTRTLTVVFAVSVLFGAMARADVLHGVGNIGDGGANAAGLKYPVMLATERGINFGPGYSYVFAQGGGQTSSTVLQPGGQVDQLVSAVQAGDVTLALMSIGDNDWFPVASSIANGSLSGVPLQNFQNSVVNNITTAVNSVLAAGGSVVLGGFSNITDSPAAAAIYANPVARANLENALSSANNQLSAYAASVGIPYIDFFGLEKTVFDSGSFVVGGVNIALHTTGPDPHNFFQDSVNAGTVIRGEIANLWLQGMNEGYGTNIPLLSDQEILALAGIGNEFVAETFAPATNFSDYTEFVPEPSSVMLLAIGLVGLVWRGLRVRGRR
jgi:hypothetical protein